MPDRMPDRTNPVARLLVLSSALSGLSGASCGAGGPAPPEPPVQTSAPASAAPIIVEQSSMKSLPVATRREDVVETLHGERVADPYRWLEQNGSPELKAWTESQNQLTARTLSAVKARSAIQSRLEELLGIGQISVPTVRRTPAGGMRYFYTRREGRQNQPVLLVRDALKGKDRVLFDPNALSPNGTLALDYWTPSQEGALVAYGTSEGGTEESTLRIRDVRTAKDLPDV